MLININQALIRLNEWMNLDNSNKYETSRLIYLFMILNNYIIHQIYYKF